MDPKNPINLDDIDFGHTLRGHQKGDRVFDRFVLEKLLGRGGMGVVWLAKDERLGREVALKFAPEAVRFDEVAVDELKEETRKGLELAHPNIVKIYDFLMDEEHAAISMEFIDGENLGALRARQPNKVFEPAQITHWVGQLLDALDYAHRGAKVIHRDLKPANLMIDREGNLRVTDFGIARSISDAMTRATIGAGNSTGTLAYMSPQQADGKKPHVTDDLYAVGSTLYELLTGKPPFYSGNIAARLHEEPAASLSERRVEFGLLKTEPIPAEWEQTVLSLLEKAPENRPPSAQAVRHRLGISGDSGELPPVPALPGGHPGMHGGPTTAYGTPPTHHGTYTQYPPHAGYPPPQTPYTPHTQGGGHTQPPPFTQTPPYTQHPSHTQHPHHTQHPPHPHTHLPMHTHARTHTQVRPGGGLTEVNLPGRPIVAGDLRVGPGLEPSPTQPQTQPQGQPASSGSSAALWIAMIGGVMGLLMMAGAGWWVWNRTPFFKKKPVDPVVVQPTKPTKSPTKTTEPPVAVVDPKKPITVTHGSNLAATTTTTEPNTPPNTPLVPKGSTSTDPGPGTPTANVSTPSVPENGGTIQARIDKAKAGEEIVVAAGNYEEQLRLKDGVKLKAAPGAKVIVQTDGRVGSVLQAKDCKSGSITGITFQHTGSEVVEGVSWPVMLVQSSSITLDNCMIQSGVSDGIVFSGVGKPQLRQCTVKNNTKNGIVFETGAVAVLTGVECRQNGESGVDARHSGTSATLQGCLLQENGLSGAAVKDGASLRVLEGTRCIKNKEAGVAAAGEDVSLTVEKITCEDNDIGISVDDYAKASIRGATLRGSNLFGIQMPMVADGSEIVDNIIEGSRSHGMLIGGASGVTIAITKNTITGSGGCGIGVFGEGFKPKIEGNQIKNSADRGILVDEGAGGIVRDNTIRGSNRSAIDRTKAAADIVIQGNITDGN